ncbi:TetR/AcrR family transcriptional regulator [Sphaerisporangium aureirubrum]|uniref:TetR/AcrR family transcriptional regulator n=1 Tax=Sphaerisporangium aureirubrum TaxID=1544736 RepID=A0ABW1NHZ1_9ACTN
MGRLTRAETQERNRAMVLAAARDEFAERGFRDAKIDAIADRAGLTRGAVYSNFPGKRALYFAVLADQADAEQSLPGEPGPFGTPGPHRPAGETPRPDGRAGAFGAPSDGPEVTAREAIGVFAREWVARFPLATDEHGPARLARDLMPEILGDDRIRRSFAQLMKLDAILLGLALERLRPAGAPAARLVRVAEAVLTTLHGAGQLAAAAPGFLEPFDVVTVCRELADLELGGGWLLVPAVPPARAADDRWSPPPATDAVRRSPADLTGDGVVAILGLHRLEAAEEAVRAAPPGTQVTAVLVSGAPGELAPLARLIVTDLCAPLRQAFPPHAWPPLQVVHDETGALAAAAGIPAVSDHTEAAVRVRAGRVVARAEGRSASLAAAALPHPSPHPR